MKERTTYACIARYQSYTAHNFDFGIFTQMFEHMRTTGLPDTTVERNILMSHFGVHFSPFYYILLPFYMIVPRPETPLVLQTVFVAAGVFAVPSACLYSAYGAEKICFPAVNPYAGGRPDVQLAVPVRYQLPVPLWCCSTFDLYSAPGC